MKTIDAKMAELKAKAQSAGEKAKAEWETQRPQLEAQRDAAAKKLDELRISTKRPGSKQKRKRRRRLRNWKRASRKRGQS
jgi:hypothetical protein